MSRRTFLVLGVGLLLGFGLPLSGGADDTGLERPGFALTSLDSLGNVGQYTSATIGADGLGLISYHDVTNRTLRGSPLLQPGLYLRHPHHPGQRRRGWSVHLHNHRGGPLRPD